MLGIFGTHYMRVGFIKYRKIHSCEIDDFVETLIIASCA